jgi:hypothetical protein
MYYLISDIALGGNCKGVLNECSDPNAKCINSKCTCSVGFYWFNKGSSQSNCRRGKVLFDYLPTLKVFVVTTSLLYNLRPLYLQ